jgi:sugar phosphate isomerase/epimerase
MNKFAFSTVACPNWDLQTIADRAKEYGYHGVEFQTGADGTAGAGADLFQAEPNAAAGIFKSAGVEIACLGSSIFFHGDRSRDIAGADELRKHLELAAKLNCGLVKILDTRVRPGQDRIAAGIAMARWLLPLADEAAGRGIAIVIENALSFRTAREMWTILEAVPHPSVGLCWDVCTAAQAGERPAVSVPMLNSRIFHAHVRDAKLEGGGPAYCKLGEGDVAVQNFLTRLMGIGYNGYVVVELDKASLSGLPEPETVLPEAIAQLKKWTQPVEKAKPVPAAAKH